MFDSIVDFIHQIQGKYTFDDPIAAYGVIAFVLLIGLEIGLSLKYDPELYQWRDFGASDTPWPSRLDRARQERRPQDRR